MAEQAPPVPIQTDVRRTPRFTRRQRRGLHLFLIFGLLAIIGVFLVTPAPGGLLLAGVS